MSGIYEPRRGNVRSSNAPLDPLLCKSGVTDNDRRAHYHQCNKKPVRDGWCAIHHPEAIASRAAASNERYEAETRKRAMGWYGERWLIALSEIRDGHNDPRKVAEEALRGCDYAARS